MRSPFRHSFVPGLAPALATSLVLAGGAASVLFAVDDEFRNGLGAALGLSAAADRDDARPIVVRVAPIVRPGDLDRPAPPAPRAVRRRADSPENDGGPTGGDVLAGTAPLPRLTVVRPSTPAPPSDEPQPESKLPQSLGEPLEQTTDRLNGALAQTVDRIDGTLGRALGETVERLLGALPDRK